MDIIAHATSNISFVWISLHTLHLIFPLHGCYCSHNSDHILCTDIIASTTFDISVEWIFLLTLHQTFICMDIIAHTTFKMSFAWIVLLPLHRTHPLYGYNCINHI